MGVHPFNRDSRPASVHDAEKADLRQLDLDAIVRRFTNKRAKEFNPSSLKEYGRRVRRALDLFLSWREDPANFHGQDTHHRRTA